MTYAVAVMVVDRHSRRGLAGQRVKCYGGPELKTDASGRAEEEVDLQLLVISIQTVLNMVSSQYRALSVFFTKEISVEHSNQHNH